MSSGSPVLSPPDIIEKFGGLFPNGTAEWNSCIAERTRSPHSLTCSPPQQPSATHTLVFPVSVSSSREIRGGKGRDKGGAPLYFSKGIDQRPLTILQRPSTSQTIFGEESI